MNAIITSPRLHFPGRIPLPADCHGRRPPGQTAGPEEGQGAAAAGGRLQHRLLRPRTRRQRGRPGLQGVLHLGGRRAHRHPQVQLRPQPQRLRLQLRDGERNQPGGHGGAQAGRRRPGPRHEGLLLLRRARRPAVRGQLGGRRKRLPRRGPPHPEVGRARSPSRRRGRRGPAEVRRRGGRPGGRLRRQRQVRGPWAGLPGQLRVGARDEARRDGARLGTPR